MMKKKFFTAFAIVNNGEREWEVVIYSHYETREEAEDGIKRFAKNYVGSNIKIISTRIV